MGRAVGREPVMAVPPADFRYIDIHTHLHPPWLWKAIRRWFAGRPGWDFRYGTEPEWVARFLADRGVERFVFFSYAHKPGLARELNAWLHETARRLFTLICVLHIKPSSGAVGTIAGGHQIRH